MSETTTGSRDKAMTIESRTNIRRASAGDAALLADLGARTFSDTFALDNTPEDMAAYLASSFSPTLQEEALSDSRVIFLIAEVDGIACGYAKMESGNQPSCVTRAHPIELSRLYVAKEFIGLGLGKALMEACIREAKAAGAGSMWLGVWERNLRAQRFYKKWDFQEVGEQAFRLGEDKQRDLVMEREI